jgi:hypothetical protein
MRVHPVGQRFLTDNELKRGIMNWLHNQIKTFYAAGISNLPECWKNLAIMA